MKMRLQHSLGLLACLLSASLVAANPFAATATKDSITCAASERECRPASGDAFCCPKKYACGEVKNQCLDEAVVTAAATASKVVTVRSTSTATPTATSHSSATTSTTVTPTPTATQAKGEVGDKIKKFFTPTMITIFAASGAGGLILVAAITFCCWRKRKQGRAMLAAYEDPDRVPYTDPVIRGPPSVSNRGSGPAVSAAGRQSPENRNSYDDYNHNSLIKEIGPLGSSGSRPTTPSAFSYGHQKPHYFEQPNGYPMQQIQPRSPGIAEHQECLAHIPTAVSNEHYPSSAWNNQQAQPDRWAPVVHTNHDSFVQRPPVAGLR